MSATNGKPESPFPDASEVDDFPREKPGLKRRMRDLDRKTPEQVPVDPMIKQQNALAKRGETPEETRASLAKILHKFAHQPEKAMKLLDRELDESLAGNRSHGHTLNVIKETLNRHFGTAPKSVVVETNDNRIVNLFANQAQQIADYASKINQHTDSVLPDSSGVRSVRAEYVDEVDSGDAPD